MHNEEAIDESRSLLQLAPEILDDAFVEEDAERTVLRLANTPLRRLRPEDLLVLVTQGVGIEYVAPLAISRLADDPILHAVSHSGDLLSALLVAGESYWRENKETWEAVMELLGEALDSLAGNLEDGQPLTEVLGDDFAAALLHFRSIHRSEEHD